jgi:hypothetical protein
MKTILPSQSLAPLPNLDNIAIEDTSKLKIPARINELVKLILVWHGETQLESLNLCGGKIRQSSHRDSPTMTDNIGKRQRLCEKVFSAILATEKGTSWVNAKGNEITIEKGSFLIWRGDYRHAGAPHKKTNQRLFFSISHRNHRPADKNKVSDIRVRLE